MWRSRRCLSDGSSLRRCMRCPAPLLRRPAPRSDPSRVRRPGDLRDDPTEAIAGAPARSVRSLAMTNPTPERTTEAGCANCQRGCESLRWVIGVRSSTSGVWTRWCPPPTSDPRSQRAIPDLGARGHSSASMRWSGYRRRTSTSADWEQRAVGMAGIGDRNRLVEKWRTSTTGWSCASTRGDRGGPHRYDRTDWAALGGRASPSDDRWASLRATTEGVQRIGADGPVRRKNGPDLPVRPDRPGQRSGPDQLPKPRTGPLRQWPASAASQLSAG